MPTEGYTVNSTDGSGENSLEGFSDVRLEPRVGEEDVSGLSARSLVGEPVGSSSTGDAVGDSVAIVGDPTGLNSTRDAVGDSLSAVGDSVGSTMTGDSVGNSTGSPVGGTDSRSFASAGLKDGLVDVFSPEKTTGAGVIFTIFRPARLFACLARLFCSS